MGYLRSGSSYVATDVTQSEFDDHSTRHENGGADEISVAGLSGVLADAQNADELQGRTLASTAPSDGQVIGWNSTGSQWEPQDLSGEYTLGANEKLIFRDGDVYAVSDAAGQLNVYAGNAEVFRVQDDSGTSRLELHNSLGHIASLWNNSTNAVLSAEAGVLFLQANGVSKLDIQTNGDVQIYDAIVSKADGDATLGSGSKGWDGVYVAESASAPSTPTTALATYVVDDGAGVKELRALFANGTDELIRDHSGNSNQSGNATIGGDLDHDGSNVGFFGTAPTTQPTALTAKDTSTVDGTYGTEEQNVIDNNRTRLEELETKLQALGLIA